MSELCVFTTGTDLDLLRQSCADVMITLKTYDCQWKGYVTGKIREALKFLQGIPEHYVMWVDGNDSLILGTEQDILSRFINACTPILIAGETNCWPDSSLSGRYQFHTHRHYLAPFINSGGYIGYKDNVMAALHTILMDASTEDDQGEWTRAYLAGMLPGVQIDYSRYLFACAGDGDQAINSSAVVKHWNGRTPGRKEYYENFRARRA